MTTAAGRLPLDPAIVWTEFLRSPLASKLSMSPLELDGYLTGIIVSPEMIRPGQWVDHFWRGDAPQFDGINQAQYALTALMMRYNTLIAEIDRNLDQLESTGACDYRPMFLTSADRPARDAVRLWVRGFWKAMALAPEAWSSLAGDARAKVLVEPFVGFIKLEMHQPFDLAGDNADDLLDQDAAVIPRMIVVLRMLAKMRKTRSRTTERRSKIGRNDACPCGSGKKYKRCCAAN